VIKDFVVIKESSLIKEFRADGLHATPTAAAAG
jgi:hypothetical protein